MRVFFNGCFAAVFCAIVVFFVVDLVVGLVVGVVCCFRGLVSGWFVLAAAAAAAEQLRLRSWEYIYTVRRCALRTNVECLLNTICAAYILFRFDAGLLFLFFSWFLLWFGSFSCCSGGIH